jgi:cation transport protein ChaC
MSPRPRAAARLAPLPGEDFWVFGYGSLIWNPGFPHLEVRAGRLRGYHRHFCVYSHVYRGTPKCPGLVLGLDRGGSCAGLAYRVPAAAAAGTIDYLYEREMITAVYLPKWVRVGTEEGPIKAATFVVDTEHKQYAGRLPTERIVDLILQGAGRNGPCVDYLENTVSHLRALGLSDRPLERLRQLVEARLIEEGRGG